MTHIRVNPASMTAYGQQATEIFAAIHGELTMLVDTVTEVQYFGPNAVEFKTRCGLLAQTFAQNLLTDISRMAEAVRVSVSNIQAALGGAVVAIEVSGRPIEAPSVAATDFVDVDTTALEAIVAPVGARFAALQARLDDHLSRLASTDWEGNAKQQAVTLVTGFTGQAKERCAEAETSISSYIADQLSAVVAADV
ncbi:MAG: hypothetical protein AAGF91_11570 [Actinomycetota bacterium]